MIRPDTCQHPIRRSCPKNSSCSEGGVQTCDSGPWVTVPLLDMGTEPKRARADARALQTLPHISKLKQCLTSNVSRMHEFPRARLIRIGVRELGQLDRSEFWWVWSRTVAQRPRITGYQAKKRSYRSRGTTDLWVSRVAAGMANRHKPNHATDPIRSQALWQDHCPWLWNPAW